MWSFVHFFFLSECQTGISTIHQLLNVSTRQGPLYSSATSGKVTRQSSVCHKLSEIIDVCCCCVRLSLSYDLFQSFTFNNTAELKEALYPRLPSQLSSRRSKGRRYGIKYFCQKRFWSGFLAAIIWSAWIKHEDDMGNTACSLRDSGDCPPTPAWSPFDCRDHGDLGIYKIRTLRFETRRSRLPRFLPDVTTQFSLKPPMAVFFNQSEGNQILSFQPDDCKINWARSRLEAPLLFSLLWSRIFRASTFSRWQPSLRELLSLLV